MSYTQQTPDQLPVPGGTRLILLRDDKSAGLTLVRETDLRRAMARGLKEYIEQLTFELDDARHVQFRNVYDHWAEPEDYKQTPSACVYSVDQLAYGGGADAESPMSPTVKTIPARGPGAPLGMQALLPGEGVQTFMVECWAQDSEQRMAVSAMLEDAFNPVDWMWGFRLELPHYFNTRAVYKCVGSADLDTEEDAAKRYRKVVFTVEARCQQVRILGPGVPLRTRVQISLNTEPEPARVSGVHADDEGIGDAGGEE